MTTPTSSYLTLSSSEQSTPGSKKIIRPDPSFMNFDSSCDDEDEDNGDGGSKRISGGVLRRETPKKRDGGVRPRPKRVQFGGHEDNDEDEEEDSVPPPAGALYSRRHTLAHIEISKEEEAAAEVDLSRRDRRRNLLGDSVSQLSQQQQTAISFLSMGGAAAGRMLKKHRKSVGGGNRSNNLSHLTSNLGRLRVGGNSVLTNLSSDGSSSNLRSSDFISGGPVSSFDLRQQPPHHLTTTGNGVILSPVHLNRDHNFSSSNSMLDHDHVHRPHSAFIIPSSSHSSSVNDSLTCHLQTASLLASGANGGRGGLPQLQRRRQLPKVPEHDAEVTETAARLVSVTLTT